MSEVAERISQITMQDVVQPARNTEWPRVEIPIREMRNTKWDESRRAFVIGALKTRREFHQINQTKLLTQHFWLLDYIKNHLLANGLSSTKRDVFYTAMNEDIGLHFEIKGKPSQTPCDALIADIEAQLGVPREKFNIFPDQRSLIFGDLSIEFTRGEWKGRPLQLDSNPDGVAIGPNLTSSDLIKTNADKVIMVEKNALFSRFVERGVHKKFNAILVGAEGQTPRSTRYLLRRLNKELSLPVYLFCDADVYGCFIASVVVYGSAGSSHIFDLNVPDAKWGGIYASDIIRYKLPSMPFDDEDFKKLKQLKNDPRMMRLPWSRELVEFERHKRKAEMEAFAAKSIQISFITETFLPERLQELGA